MAQSNDCTVFTSTWFYENKQNLVLHWKLKWYNEHRALGDFKHTHTHTNYYI